MLRATIELIHEGHLDPTVQQIVERSGTPERSIFRYFDKEELAQQALKLAASELGAEAELDRIGEGPFDDRVERLVSTRLALLTQLKHLARAARLRAAQNPDLDDAMAANAQRLHAEYGAHFAPELDAMDDSTAGGVLDAITTLLSFDGFNLQDRRLGRDDDDIAAGWTTSLHRLLS